MIDMERLDQHLFSEKELDKVYKKCEKFKDESDKIFKEVMKVTLDLTDKSKELTEIHKKLNIYRTRIDTELETSVEKASMLALSVQVMDISKEWQKRSDSLVKSLQQSWEIAIKSFTDYFNKISQAKRETYL